MSLKHKVHQNAFQYHWAIWAVFSKNVNYLQSWTKLLQQNKKSVFQWKNSLTPPPQINVVREVLRFLQQNLGRFNTNIGASWGEFWIWKIKPFFVFTGFSTFCLSKFCPRLWQIFKTFSFSYGWFLYVNGMLK